MMFYHGLEIDCRIDLYTDVIASRFQPDDGFWRLIAWLNATDAPKHKAVKLLNLRIRVLSNSTLHRELHTHNIWARLARALKRSQYTKPRLQLQLMENKGSHPLVDLDEWFVHRNQAMLVRDALFRDGLDARVIWHDAA